MKLSLLVMLLLSLSACKVDFSRSIIDDGDVGKTCHTSKRYNYTSLNSESLLKTSISIENKTDFKSNSCAEVKDFLWNQVQDKLQRQTYAGEHTYCYDDNIMPVHYELALHDEPPVKVGGVTNNQVAEVDESDLVKVTKKYIVVTKPGFVEVIDRQNLSITQTISVNDMSSVELFYANNYLVIIGSQKKPSNTKVVIYHEDELGNLTFLRNYLFSGHLRMARLSQGKIYLKNINGIRVPNIVKENQSVEEVYNNFSKEFDSLNLDCANLVSKSKAIEQFSAQISFTHLHTIDLSSAELSKSKISLIGNYNEDFTTDKNIYLIKNNSSSQEIIKIEQDNSTEVKAIGNISGLTIGQWSYGEYNDELYVALRKTDGKNYLYSFIDNEGMLVKNKSSQGFAFGETIRSVRYKESKAYIVTYRQIDPLFVLDLTLPSDISILGELKIPGFSKYMHNYNDDRMIGLGFTDRGRLQLSMFDVNDDSNPQVLQQLELPEYSDSDVFLTHQAFFYSQSMNWLAFPVDHNGAMMFKYSDESKFYQKTKIDHSDLINSKCGKPVLNIWSGVSSDINRVFELDGRLLSVSRFGLKSHDLSNPERILEQVTFTSSESDCYEQVYLLCGFAM